MRWKQLHVSACGVGFGGEEVFGLYELTSKTNPTEYIQTQVRKVINNSKALILPDEKWQHIDLNPSAPSIKGLIKLHKPEHLIHPVVNWRGAPAYKLAQLLTNKIRLIAPLPHIYTVSNTRELINKLECTPIPRITP